MKPHVLGLFLIVSCGSGGETRGAEFPNILVIYADDLGYGDLQCYNSAGMVPTPNLNRVAAEGMRFTDAHSPSTVCTPSRYGVMTGRMPFRTGFRGVFTGVEGPCLIESGRLTWPELLRRAGYTTALFGKWHLGMTFLDRNGRPVYESNQQSGVELVQKVDFSRPIQDGPLAHGFDFFFGTVSCPTTDWLYAWIDGDRVLVPPIAVRDRSRLPNHPYSHDFRAGLVAPDFDFEQVDQVLLEKSQAFLIEHRRSRSEKPFFLFHSTQAVHLPSFAAPQYQGKSGAGPHGDFIFQFDQHVGELLRTLNETGFANETLVIVTSDNGPEVSTTLRMRTDHQHDGARPWRGMKRDQWEGGHRVPFLVRWPQKIKPGTTSSQTVCQTDLMHTTLALLGIPLPVDAAEDSFNLLPILLGEDEQPVRPYTLHQTIRLDLAIRRGAWKYLDHPGSGGNDYRRGELAGYALPDPAADAPVQLYDLQSDPGETKNVYLQHPEIVQDLQALLRKSIEDGRSRP